jgi:outer membrane lipoprotein SlyB
MIKIFMAIIVSMVLLNGCAANNTASGDTFTAGQARQMHIVTYGTLVSVRPITIRGRRRYRRNAGQLRRRRQWA